jgi:sirohydrochlorin ferrochelatase
VPSQHALIILDHGSRQPEANELVIEIAARVRTRRPDYIVEPAHMEMASPSLDEAVAACRSQGARQIAVLPYFLAPGRHTRETIPGQVDEVAGRYPDLEFRIGEPLGCHESLVDVLLERADALGTDSLG